MNNPGVSNLDKPEPTGMNCLRLCFLDSSVEIITGDIIFFEAELPSQAFPSGAWE
jgi:hypothetical protein